MDAARQCSSWGKNLILRAAGFSSPSTSFGTSPQVGGEGRIRTCNGSLQFYRQVEFLVMALAARSCLQRHLFLFALAKQIAEDAGADFGLGRDRRAVGALTGGLDRIEHLFHARRQLLLF